MLSCLHFLSLLPVSSFKILLSFLSFLFSLLVIRVSSHFSWSLLLLPRRLTHTEKGERISKRYFRWITWAVNMTHCDLQKHFHCLILQDIKSEMGVNYLSVCHTSSSSYSFLVLRNRLNLHPLQDVSFMIHGICLKLEWSKFNAFHDENWMNGFLVFLVPLYFESRRSWEGLLCLL